MTSVTGLGSTCIDLTSSTSPVQLSASGMSGVKEEEVLRQQAAALQSLKTPGKSLNVAGDLRDGGRVDKAAAL